MSGFYTAVPLKGDESELSEVAKEFLSHLENFYADGIWTPEDIMPPPGKAGELVTWALRTAWKQVPIYSMFTVLATMAGWQGQRYYIRNNGLNIYATIQGGTGTGKNMVNRFEAALRKELGADKANEFVSVYGSITGDTAFGEMVGAATNGSFLMKVTEQAALLKSFAEGKFGLNEALMTAFTSSGNGDIIRLKKKAGQDAAQFKDTAVSMLGDLTAKDFDELFTDELISCGLMVRNICAPPPARDQNPWVGDIPKLDGSLKQTILDQLTYCSLGKNADRQRVEVKFDAQVKEYSAAHGAFCTAQASKCTSEEAKEYWTRTDEKVERVAANIAAFNNRLEPVIDLHTYDWARQLVWMCDIRIIRLIENGQIGVGANRQVAEIVEFVRGVAKMKPPERRENFYKNEINALDKKSKSECPYTRRSDMSAKLTRRAVFYKKANGGGRKESAEIKREFDAALDLATEHGLIIKITNPPAFFKEDVTLYAPYNAG